MRKLISLLSRFRKDEAGAFMVLFGILAIVLIATSGAVVDFTAIEQARTKSQTAMDATALALQPRIYDTDVATLTSESNTILQQQLNDPEITSTVTSVVPNTTLGSITINATITKPTWFVALVGVPSITASLTSTATRGATNLEIGLALDTTGSMTSSVGSGKNATTKIAALQVATQHLINLVVQDQQTPTYSKMALVPYSMGVNLGTYAASVRGDIQAGKTITGAAWMSGTTKNITGATTANPVVITAKSHGFLNGDHVYIESVKGMTQLNGKIFTVANVKTDTFSLSGVNGKNYDSYSYNGKVTKCLTSACEVVVTASNHGFANDDWVRITGVKGMTQINDTTWQAESVATNTFVLSGSDGPHTDPYTSSGSAYCTTQISAPWCEYFRFQNHDATWKTFEVSSCVTERATNPYTDDPPTTTLLGLNYPPSLGNCIAQSITPLTSDKTVLQGQATNLKASGSTGGHIGLAWAWYMLAPNFGYLWPEASQRPAAYSAPNTLKVLIMMTDGAFNSPYCKGVISYADAVQPGSGSDSDHINCSSNGTSLVQAGLLCTEIKKKGIVVYTVGFDIGTDPGAQSLMTNCATDTNKVYTAVTGADLDDAFTKIAGDLAELRLTQ